MSEMGLEEAHTEDSEALKRSSSGCPALNDEVHCLVTVLPALETPERHAVIEKINKIKDEARKLEIPHVVVITKVDEACPAVKNDLEMIYWSKTIKRNVDKCTSELGDHTDYVFPVKNYHDESDLNNNVDILLLSALQHIIKCADNHVKHMEPKFMMSHDGQGGSSGPSFSVAGSNRAAARGHQVPEGSQTRPEEVMMSHDGQGGSSGPSFSVAGSNRAAARGHQVPEGSQTRPEEVMMSHDGQGGSSGPSFSVAGSNRAAARGHQVPEGSQTRPEEVMMSHDGQGGSSGPSFSVAGSNRAAARGHQVPEGSQTRPEESLKPRQHEASCRRQNQINRQGHQPSLGNRPDMPEQEMSISWTEKGCFAPAVVKRMLWRWQHERVTQTLAKLLGFYTCPQSSHMVKCTGVQSGSD
ncbi:uncharacterized protein LOC134447368 [Engraulis encrasicolus]|uniref:uncharacterized protein LOC134447368 n=1 Tax=Engraulis encrasicolus TaxID=184585 RepID=UPI002FD24713